MEFLRVAFSLFLRGEERQGSVKKKKKNRLRRRGIDRKGNDKSTE